MFLNYLLLWKMTTLTNKINRIGEYKTTYGSSNCIEKIAKWAITKQIKLTLEQTNNLFKYLANNKYYPLIDIEFTKLLTIDNKNIYAFLKTKLCRDLIQSFDFSRNQIDRRLKAIKGSSFVYSLLNKRLFNDRLYEFYSCHYDFREEYFSKYRNANHSTIYDLNFKKIYEISVEKLLDYGINIEEYDMKNIEGLLELCKSEYGGSTVALRYLFENYGMNRTLKELHDSKYTMSDLIKSFINEKMRNEYIRELREDPILLLICKNNIHFVNIVEIFDRNDKMDINKFGFDPIKGSAEYDDLYGRFCNILYDQYYDKMNETIKSKFNKMLFGSHLRQGGNVDNFIEIYSINKPISFYYDVIEKNGSWESLPLFKKMIEVHENEIDRKTLIYLIYYKTRGPEWENLYKKVLDMVNIHHGEMNEYINEFVIDRDDACVKDMVIVLLRDKIITNIGLNVLKKIHKYSSVMKVIFDKCKISCELIDD